MKEYSISPTQRALGFIFAAVFIAGGMYAVFNAATHVTPDKKLPITFLGLMLLGTGYIILVSVKRLSVTVDYNVMKIQTGFTNEEVFLSDIQGFRYGDKGRIYIVRKDGRKQIAIPQSIRDRNDLIQWLETNYEDVDAKERETETSILQEDELYGDIGEEREAMLAKAKSLGTATIVVGLLLMLWIFIYPEPYPWPVYLGMIAPWIGVYLTWKYKGLLRLYSLKKSPSPSVIYLMAAPVAGVFVIALKYNINSFPGSAVVLLLEIILVLSVAAVYALRPAIAAEAQKGIAIAVIVLVIGVYSFGLLVFSNCYYDQSPAQIYPARIIDKYVTTGKTTSYNIRLSAWKQNIHPKEITVSKYFYNSVNLQDTVNVFFNKGKWGIPWYRVVQRSNN